jgi:O-antigen/teichoic acid export membrane protein
MALMLIFAAHDWLFPGIPVNDLLLSILLIPTTLFAAHLTSLFRGLQDFRTYNWIEMVSQPLALLLTLALVWWPRLGVLGAILAITARYALALVMCITILRHRLGDQRILVYEWDWAYVRQMLSYGFRAYWYYIVTFLNQRADVFLLNLLGVGAAVIGLYDVAVTLGERMWVLSRSVSMVTFSRVAALEKMEAERTALTTIAARYIFWLGLVASVVVFLLADWVIVLLYGVEYRASALALRLLLPGIVTLGMGHVLSNDIAGRGKPEIIAAQSAFAVGLNIFLNLVLIPRLNFPGASIASVISYTAQTLLLLLTFCRLSGVRWTELFIPTRADFRRIQTSLQWGITKLRRPSVIEP